MSRSFCRSRMRAAELNERIDEFNARATGIGDGRLLQAELRDDQGALVAGLTGWTWGGCRYIDVLWVREDHRGSGLGRRLLHAAETEAHERGCTQIVTSSHSLQGRRWRLLPNDRGQDFEQAFTQRANATKRAST